MQSNAYLDASGWQLEQALHGLPPEALHPLGIHQLPHPVLRETKPQRTETLSERTESSDPSPSLLKFTGENEDDLEEVDDVRLEQRALAAEEGGEGFHALARVRAAARRSCRHRAGRREVGCVGRGTEPELESEVRSSQ